MSFRHTQEMRSEQRRGCRATSKPLRLSSGRVGRRLVAAVGILLAAAIVGPAGAAAATPPAPTIAIAGLRAGNVTNNPSPLFSGTGAEEGGEVTLRIYSGGSPTGTALQKPKVALSENGTWETTAEHLADGTYTAQVAQEDETELGLEQALSESVTFTIDTTPPAVTITSPANGSSTSSQEQSVAGSGGIEPGDSSPVTVNLVADSATASPARESLILPVTGSGWSGTFGGLSPGTYTLQAEQTDDAGNLGLSAPVTFTVTPPPLPAVLPGPSASFTWFPTSPKTGEDVALVSSATDSASAITGWSWALSKPGAFTAGKPLITTSFSTPGSHTVQLQVTAANGQSSVATETINVGSAPLVLMQPFPIVRIAGSETYSGVDLRLLTAQAPAGSHVTITCKGHGCPAKSVSQVATAGKHKGSTVTVEFRRFERSLPAGVVLEIRIYKAGEIGKFTRFTVRRGKLPERGDSCLAPAGVKPIVCPSS